MRKITKIFAILLTLCLLSGVMVSVVASAAEQGASNGSLNVSGHNSNYAWDFETNPGWISLSDMIFAQGGPANGNKYFQMSSDGKTGGTLTGGSKNTVSGGRFNLNLKDIKYFTLDYDIGTDRYVYWDSDGVSHTYVDGEPITDLSQVPEDAIKVLPAYGTFGQSYLYYRASSSGYFGRVEIRYDEEADKHYFTTNSGEGKLYLSNEVGVFDHVTTVVEIVKDGTGACRAIDHFYLNGEYLTSVENKSYASGAEFNLLDLRADIYSDDYFLGKNVTSRSDGTTGLKVGDVTLYEGDSFSLVLDNVALNFYDSECGLDDFHVENGMVWDTNKPLYTCPDVLYYNYKLSPNGYIEVDGKIAFLKDKIEDLLNNVKDDSHIISATDILDFDVPEGIESFTVEMLMGKEFSLSGQSKNAYLITDVLGNSFTVRKIRDSDAVTARWVCKNGDKEVILREDKLLINVDPIAPTVVPFIDDETGNLLVYHCSDWQFDIDGNFPNINLYEQEPIRALDMWEVMLIQEDFGGIITIYAQNVNVDVIDYSAGEEIPRDISVIKWINHDETVMKTVASLSNVTVSKPSLEGVVTPTDSEWFSLGYSWKNTTPGVASDSFKTVYGLNTFVATPSKLVADVNAMLNMSYWSHFSINLHLPKQEGIVFLPTEADGETGFFSESQVRITSGVGATKVVYENKVIDTYYVQDFPNTDSFEDYVKTVKFIVSEYDINGNGEIEDNEKNIPLEQSFRFNDLEYATKVAKSYDCGSEELKLIYAYVNYKYEVYKSITAENEFSARAEELFGAFFAELANHSDCECAVDYTGVNELFTDEEKAITEDSYAELVYNKETGEKTVIGVSYVLDISKPAISIYVAKGLASTPEITVKYLNNITGGDDNHAIISSPVEVTVDGIECLRYDLVEIAAENINSVFEITVHIGDDDYVGSYCLAEYIENQPEVTLAKVYYAYANACKNYAKAIKEQYDVSDYGVVVEN